MAGSPTLLPESRLGSTLRRDAWWTEILPVIIVLGGFGIYATLRAFEGKYYDWGPYLSPFYSPLIDPEHRWWKFSPALLILAGPLGFRATCYYYRKAAHSSWIPPLVPLVNRRDAITEAKPLSPSSCKTSIATFFIWRFFLLLSSGTTQYARFSSMAISASE